MSHAPRANNQYFYNPGNPNQLLTLFNQKSLYDTMSGNLNFSGGKGNVQALNSASHGAGRLMGRKQALNSITKTMRNNYLRERDVTLMGGDLDESPQAYKPIEQVIAAQTDLVDLVGKFTPRIVKMDGR